MTVIIILAIIVALALIFYVFYLNRKLLSVVEEQAGVDTQRINRAEALEDKQIQADQNERKTHVKETNASDLLRELSTKLRARSSQ